jgi:hypothetical protein
MKWIETIDREEAEDILKKSSLYINKWEGISDLYADPNVKHIVAGKEIDKIYVALHNIIHSFSTNDWILLKFDYSSALTETERMSLTTRLCLSCERDASSLEDNIYLIRPPFDKFKKSQLVSFGFEILLYESFVYIVTKNKYIFLNDGYSIDIILNSDDKKIAEIIETIKEDPTKLL